MRKTIISALVLSAVTANAQQQQVGINTAEPKATLHVEAGASENKGVIIPRITAAEMKTMTTGLGADHHSMMTYLKEQMPTADRIGKLADVTEPGYYFYDNTTGVQKWKALGGEQDFRKVWLDNYLTKDAGIGGNGTSLGTGDGSIGIGRYTFGGFASSNDLTGRMNIALGRQTYNFQNGAATMSGNNNIGIGEILYDFQNGGSMQGWRNIAMGRGIYTFQKINAQFSNTASGNMGIGSQLFDLRNGDMTGGNNTAIGGGSFYVRDGDMTISSSIGIGLNLYRVNKPTGGILGGGNNIGIGNNSFVMQNGNFTGGINISIGHASYHVLNGDMTAFAHKNISMGHENFRLTNTSAATFTGRSNIAIGSLLYRIEGNLTGKMNIAIGDEYTISGKNLTGDENIVLGNAAMSANYGNISGSKNIALGRGALSFINIGDIGGNNNIGIGEETLTNVSGNQNIAIGHKAGYKLGYGNGNIFLGNKDMGTATAGQPDNIVAIGNGMSLANTQQDNVILLGKTGSDSPKIGMGTYQPQAKLDVAGGVRVADDTSACTSANAGTIRYDGTNFYGCTSSGWKQLNN